MPPIKPPIGVMPRSLWSEQHPAPTAEELLDRAGDVFDAIKRHIDAGVVPKIEWVEELMDDSLLAGLADPTGPGHYSLEPSTN
jgi:hypothetical protein